MSVKRLVSKAYKELISTKQMTQLKGGQKTWIVFFQIRYTDDQ